MFHRNHKNSLTSEGVRKGRKKEKRGRQAGAGEEEDGNKRKRMERRKTKHCRGFRFKSLPNKVVKLVKLVYNPFAFDIP